jgi:hypothetical protein
MALAVALVIVSLVSSAAFAQCSPARRAAMRGDAATHGRVGVNVFSHIPVLNNQTEVGSIWESGNPGNNTGGPHFGGLNTCPSATSGPAAGTPWWITGGAGTQPAGARSIEFFIGSGICFMPACPNSLTVLVEDVTADGSDAAYYLTTVDAIPANAVRVYDFSRGDAASQPSNDVTHPMWNLPRVDVQSSSGPPPNTTLTNAYQNAEVAVWGAGPFGGPTQQVTHYDIYAVHAPAPPGRARTLWGAPLKSIPYTNVPPGAPVADTVDVPCPTTANDTYVAVGLTFDGSVKSFYVGKHTVVECDPSIADPEAPADFRRRPSTPRQFGRSGR